MLNINLIDPIEIDENCIAKEIEKSRIEEERRKNRGVKEKRCEVLEEIIKEFKKYSFDKPFYMGASLNETNTENILTTAPIEVFMKPKRKVVCINGRYDIVDIPDGWPVFDYIINSYSSFPLKRNNEWVFPVINTPELAEMVLKYIDNPILNDKDYNLFLKYMSNECNLVRIPAKKTYSMNCHIELPIPNLSDLSILEQCMFIKQFLISLSNINDLSNIHNYSGDIVRYDKVKIKNVEFILGKSSENTVKSINIADSDEDDVSHRNPKLLYVDNGAHFNIDSNKKILSLDYYSPEYKTIERGFSPKEINIHYYLKVMFKKFDLAMKNFKGRHKFTKGLYKLFDKGDFMMILTDPSNVTYNTDYRAKLIKEKKKCSMYYKDRVRIIKDLCESYLSNVR